MRTSMAYRPSMFGSGLSSALVLAKPVLFEKPPSEALAFEYDPTDQVTLSPVLSTSPAINSAPLTYLLSVSHPSCGLDVTNSG